MKVFPREQARTDCANGSELFTPSWEWKSKLNAGLQRNQPEDARD